jgi:hypothetical protein
MIRMAIVYANRDAQDIALVEAEDITGIVHDFARNGVACFNLEKVMSSGEHKVIPVFINWQQVENVYVALPKHTAH